MILAAGWALVQAPSIPYEWKNVAIGGGGFVTGVIPHPTEKDLIYCRTDIGGAYRWDPKRLTWIPLQDWIARPDWNLYGVESLALDPSDPNRVYIAAGTYTNEWGGNGAILRSRDRGVTWDRTDLPFKNGGNEDGRSIGERLAVDPSNGRTLLFGTRHNGLMRSDDYGATWHQVETFPVRGRTNRIGIGWVLFDPHRKRIYVGVASASPSLYWSDDGKSWNLVEGQPAKLIPHQAKLASDGTLYVVYGDQPGPNGVTDGAVWKLDSGTGAWTEITPEKPGAGNTFGYAGVAIDPANPSVVMVSTLCRWTRHDTVFRSTDGGRTWLSLAEKSQRDTAKAPYLKWARPEAEFGHWIGDVEIDPHNPYRAWYVTGATIWSTSNLTHADRGQTTFWSPFTDGLEETAVIDLISPPVGARVVSALGDIAGFKHVELDRSPPNGMRTNPLWNTTTDLDYARAKPNIVVRVGYGSGPHGAISLDGGETWKPFAGAPPSGKPAGTIAISTDGSSTVWAPEGVPAHVSKDSGKTLTPCGGAPHRGRVISDKSHPRLVFIHDSGNGKVYRSEDGGRTFRQGAAVQVHDDPGKMQSSPRLPGDLWLPLKEKGLFRSQDKGKSFVRVGTVEGGEQVGFGKPIRNRAFPTIFLIGKVGGVYGVFRSTDEAKTWVRINDAKTGFGTMQVIEGDPKQFGRVYLGTNGRGVLYGSPR